MKHCGMGVYIRPMSSDIKGLWNLSVGDGTVVVSLYSCPMSQIHHYILTH